MSAEIIQYISMFLPSLNYSHFVTNEVTVFVEDGMEKTFRAQAALRDRIFTIKRHV